MVKPTKKKWLNPALQSGSQMPTMGKRIAAARKAKGLSQVTLAKAVGVSKGAISQYEMDAVEDIGSRIMLRLSDTLDVAAKWLIYGGEKIARPIQVDPEELEMLLLYRDLPAPGRDLLREKANEYHRASGAKPRLKRPTS